MYAPFLLFVLLGSLLYFAVYALLSRDRSNNPIARLARQRVMLHCLLYLLMYGLLLGLLAAGYANYALVRRTGAEGEAFFAHVTAALTVGRPVFGFVGWSLINRVPQRTFQAACCWSDAESAGARRLAPLQQPLLPTRNSSDSEPPGKGWLSRRQKPAAAAASLAAAADAAGAVWVWLGGRARAAFRGGQLAIDEPGGAGGRLQEELR